MGISSTTLIRASHKLSLAASYCDRADALSIYGVEERALNRLVHTAESCLSEAANLLGFDVVKRQPAPVITPEPEVFNDPRNEEAA